MQNLPPEPDNHKSLSVLLGIILVCSLALIVAFGVSLVNNDSQPVLPPAPAPITCVVVGNVVKCNTTDLAVAAKYCPAGKIVANTYQLRNDNSRTTFICARKGDRDYND